MSQEFTRRYTAYSRFHGRGPESMLEHDKKRWPGGQMCGFILWVQSKWHEFAKLHGVRDSRGVVLKYGADKAHDMFDTWLEEGLCELQYVHQG